jgi:hypothetical protein
MNKEIIHQRHKLTQKIFYTTIERSREVMSIPTGILFRTATESIANWLKTF